MSEPPSQAHQVLPASESETDRAKIWANKLILAPLSSKVNSKPTADLSKLLVQQATSYPKLREYLVQTALRRSDAASAEDTSGSLALSDGGNNSDNTQQFQKLLVADPVAVVLSLHERIQSLIGGQRGGLVEGLNEVINKGPARAVEAPRHFGTRHWGQRGCQNWHLSRPRWHDEPGIRQHSCTFYPDPSAFGMFESR